MVKIIEINKFQTIKTNDQTVIDQALLDGLIVIDEPNPSPYLEDESDRPENIGKAQRELDRITEQDNINETVNRPNLISDLDSLDYNDLDKATRDVLPFDQLVDYHSNMSRKPKIIRELLIAKGLPDIKENWDLEGAKTLGVLVSDLATERAKEKVTTTPAVDNSGKKQDLLNILLEIPYNDLDELARDDLPYEELTIYHSNMVQKQNLILELLKLKGLEGTLQQWNVEGLKTFEQLQAEIQTIKDSQVD